MSKNQGRAAKLRIFPKAATTTVPLPRQGSTHVTNRVPFRVVFSQIENILVSMYEPEKKNIILLFSALWGRDVPFLRFGPFFRGVCFIVAQLFFVSGASNPALSGESPKIVFETSELTIISGGSRHHFRIEVADTPTTRQRGLMERRHLDADAGMLFDYGKPRQIHMWMKNTFIPLDMVFIDQSGMVTGVRANTTPLSTAVISSPGPVLGVLELNAGIAKRLSIGMGDRIIHEIFQR